MPKSMKALLLSLVLIAYLAGSIVARAQLVGDLNADHVVDFEDLRLLTEHWLDPNCLIPGCNADLDGSDGVGMVDFALLAENWQVEGMTLIISEFLTLNGSSLPLEQGELLDEDGDSSDWIEIYNTTGASINLNGWYLSNDVNDLAMWELPPVQLGTGEFKIIFASEKDRDDPDGELHTNFRISGSAGFLALVKPDGTTIVHSYEYPQQFGDISYGIADPNGAMFATEVLVPEYTDAKAFIPQDDSLGMDWTEIDFNDSGWLEGRTGVGYDYGSLIGLNVSAMRYNNKTVYIRIPFEVNDLSDLEGLKLRMKFEDGFAAYINNDQLITSDNAPNNLQWDSGALSNRDDGIAVNFKDFLLSDDYIDYLQIGTNVLAFHGLNIDLSSSDLLVLPKLEVNRTGTIDISSVIEGYFFTPTPGALNGAGTVNFGPAIRKVTKNPPKPADDKDLIITTEISETFNSVQTVRLHYRIMYASEVDVLMIDDGLHGDGDAADGVYGAVIPASASAPGEMIRWYVTAEDVNNQASRSPMLPYLDNSPEYFGTVVKDPTVNTQLSVIEWFVENVAASETDSGTQGSVYYLGEFYDNIVIHRRGGSTASNGWNDKKHFKFNLNRGYKFKFDPDKSRVNEFNLNCTYSDKAYLRQSLAFEAYDWCGCPGSISFPVRAQRNGQFRGVYVFIEEPEEELLEREGLDPDGALYKMYSTFTGPGEKKTRRWEGTADISNFISSINNTSGTILHNNIFDQVNIPLTLNYLVATILTHQNDHPHKNHYLYRDSDGSGEWFFLPWDHDLTWGSNWTGSSYHDYIYADDDQVSGKPTNVKPSHPFVGKQDCQEWNYHWNNLIDALFEDVTVRQMYLRRLRTVMDELLKPPGTPYNELIIENRIDELVAQMASDVALDYAQYPWQWGGQDGYPINQSFDYAINVIKNDYLAVRRYHLFVTHNIDNAGSYNIAGSYSALIPNAQSVSQTINFGSYEYNPASHNQDEEYIELINPNAYAVDISGYKLTGAVEHTFLPGTVIVSGGSLYVSPNVRTFRARSASPTGGEGNFVQGNYRGHLSSWGETINLLDSDGTLVNTFTYVGNPSDQQRYLRITEVMYHPADANEGSQYNDEEFEYIELKNIGSAPLPLDGIKFTKGIYFTFPAISLPGGKYLLVVKNQAAFTSRYTVPGDVQIIGPYDGQLSNAGEDIKLEDLTNSTILDLEYKDGWRPATDGDGFSLTIINPKDSAVYSSEGLVAHWKFDDGSGSTAIDSAGTNNGTLNGDPNWTAGRIDGALNFDGDGDYVSVAPIAPLIGNTVTAQAWVRVSEFAGIWNPILTQNAGGNGYYFYASSGRPAFYIVVGAFFIEAISLEVINADQWYHFAGTNDGSNLKIYVDGQLKDSVSSTGFLGVNHGAYIGYEPTSLIYYNGLIDDVRIYDRAVSESEFQDITDPMRRWSRKSSWRASVYRNGSPGADDSGILPNPGAVVINEVMAHSNAGPDWIELHNTTDDNIDISGWFLSDNDRDEPNLTKYKIANGTTIYANDYLVFYQDTDFNNPGDPGCLVPFALSENGEEATISSRLDPNGFLTGYRDVEDFGASATNVSFGRYFKPSTGNFNFVAMDYNTPDANNVNPKVGPIVINEIMYNPPTGNQNEEYIELHNITGAPFTLYRVDKLTPWKFTDGIDYTFPDSPPVTIPANGYLMVVKDLAAFIARYGSMPPGVQVLDGYIGRLSNAGERLQIAMPGDIDGLGTRHYIRIDRVTYSDGLHPEDVPGGVDLWPKEADGLGKSLSRKVSDDYGNDVINWQAATPSPGVANP